MYDDAAYMRPTSLRIDTAIKPVSYLRILLYLVLISVIVLLAGLAQLPLWYYAVILIVSIAVASYLLLSKPKLLHLSQPPLTKPINQGWQLLMRTGRGDELWRAKLGAVHRYQWLISFEFITTEPFKRPLVVSIYRDQVSVDEWRQLNILANIVGNNIVG